jgi:hypothetical protein
MIKEVFPPEELATAFGGFGPVMGISRRRSGAGRLADRGGLLRDRLTDDLPDQSSVGADRHCQRGGLPASRTIVLAGVEPRETGVASGTLTALQQFSGSLGAAVLGTIFFGLLTNSTRTAFTHALRDTLWVAAGLQILVFILAFLLPRKARA